MYIRKNNWRAACGVCVRPVSWTDFYKLPLIYDQLLGWQRPLTSTDNWPSKKEILLQYLFQNIPRKMKSSVCLLSPEARNCNDHVICQQARPLFDTSSCQLYLNRAAIYIDCLKKNHTMVDKNYHRELKYNVLGQHSFHLPIDTQNLP